MSEEETWRDVLPSDEECKILDKVAEKYTAQKLRILDEEQSRTRIGKISDFFSGPSFDELPYDFANAVKEYLRLKLVVKMRIQAYEKHPNSQDAKNSLFQVVLSFRDVVKQFDRLYYQALAEHRVDEGFGKELDDLRATKVELTAKVNDLTSKLTECEKNLEGIRKRLPDTAEFGDVSSSH